MILLVLCLGWFLPMNTVSPTSLSPAGLLDQTEALACRYFIEQILPNGLVRDTSRPASPASIAATGFGLAALTILAERSGSSSLWQMAPSDAEARAVQIARTLAQIQEAQPDAPELYGWHGFFYHFSEADGTRAGKCEVSTVDTAILMAGLYTAAAYFGGETAEITATISVRLDWAAFLMPGKDASFEGTLQFSHGWSPERGIFRATWDRPTDETLLIHLLALAQQPDNLDFQRAFFGYPRVTREYQGIPVVCSYFGSLFTYIFAHCFYDFRLLGSDAPEQVAGIPPETPAVDWWLNSRRAAEANRAFCVAHRDEYPWYGEDAWGLSACYDPNGKYLGSLGAAPSERPPFHNGTLPPYGAVSCLPFFEAPLEQNPGFRALRHYAERYGETLWGNYGPRDAIHPGRPTPVVPFYVGIDVGPMALMIENHRSGLIWQLFMKYPGVLEGTRPVFDCTELSTGDKGVKQ